VLRANELKDFKPSTRIAVLKNARACVPSRYVSVIVLRPHRFVACARELLASKALGSTGISTVTQFRTSRGARYQLATQLGTAKRRGSNYVAFSVRGIPHAYGYRLS